MKSLPLRIIEQCDPSTLVPHFLENIHHIQEIIQFTYIADFSPPFWQCWQSHQCMLGTLLQFVFKVLSLAFHCLICTMLHILRAKQQLSDTLGRMRPMFWSSQPQTLVWSAWRRKEMYVPGHYSISFPRDPLFHWALYTHFWLDCRPYWGSSLAFKTPGRVQAFIGKEKSPKSHQRDTECLNAVIQWESPDKMAKDG